MSAVIKVESLSKKYIIRHQTAGRYVALRDVLTNGAINLGRRILHPFAERPPDDQHEAFWALKDVSFEINQGDRVGIIGRNGAGKSTLLKILSRITEPTSGRVSIKGRVASLLEVGTGFHPELTGRENIFLNGAVLGMSKAEIKRKFDEIVDFAEVEKFLDTPVKRYSSGMYVRLAFAVAAHLEPEILVVDEVLAVGDAQFQKKCLGKMQDVSAKEGRTVLFVSHNIGAINSLCNTGILLQNGLCVKNDNISSVLNMYMAGSDANRTDTDPCRSEVTLSKPIVIRKWGVGTQREPVSHILDVGSDLNIWLIYESILEKGNLLFVFSLRDIYGNVVLVLHNGLEGYNIRASKTTAYINAMIKNINLRPGSYKLGLEIWADREKKLDIELGRIDMLYSSFFSGAEHFENFPSMALFRSEWSHNFYAEENIKISADNMPKSH